MGKWEKRFVDMACLVASWSKDPNTKIGAIIVGNNKEVVSVGYNGLPRGIDDSIAERSSREGGEKYYWYEHGERNAIYNASRMGISTLSTTMYLNCGIPCADCARAIIQAGISKIVCRETCITTRSKWDEHAKRSRIMFKEAGVGVVLYDE